MQALAITQPRWNPSQAKGTVSKELAKGPEEHGRVDQMVYAGRWACKGAIPLYGASANMLATLGFGIGNGEKPSDAFIGGMYANVLGTGALITGLAIGNDLVRNVGFGLLGVAGFCSAYGAHQSR